jgi:hypothetical protein
MHVVRILAALILSGTCAKAADVDIAQGQLTHDDGSYSTQTNAATNNTGAIIETLWIECGFFRKGALLAAGKGYADNVQPRQTAYLKVLADHAEDADKAVCRVGSVQ